MRFYIVFRKPLQASVFLIEIWENCIAHNKRRNPHQDPVAYMHFPLWKIRPRLLVGILPSTGLRKKINVLIFTGRVLTCWQRPYPDSIHDTLHKICTNPFRGCSGSGNPSHSASQNGWNRKGKESRRDLRQAEKERPGMCRGVLFLPVRGVFGSGLRLFVQITPPAFLEI